MHRASPQQFSLKQETVFPVEAIGIDELILSASKSEYKLD